VGIGAAAELQLYKEPARPHIPTAQQQLDFFDHALGVGDYGALSRTTRQVNGSIEQRRKTMVRRIDSYE
jgi:hypothetical protein